MLTGDAIAIAKETCKMLSLGTKVYNAEKLFNSGLSGSLQHDLIDRADGFAEVFPEHKYQVVEMLQQRGSLTAMTGDGKHCSVYGLGKRLSHFSGIQLLLKYWC